jgi:hypothetical protein
MSTLYRDNRVKAFFRITKPLWSSQSWRIP